MQDEVIFGINAVTEALRGKRRAFELFVGPQPHDRRLSALVELAAEKGVQIRQRQKQDLARLSGSEYHQGVVLRVEPFPYADLEELSGTWKEQTAAGVVLVLDSVQDPGNLGSLVRSAACAGVLGIVIPKDRAAAVTPAVERVSAGAVETIPIARVTNIVHALELLKGAGFWVYGLDHASPQALFQQDLLGRVALVVGSEGEGIRPLVGKNCDLLLSIPLQGGVGSLNAAVAGSIAIFCMGVIK